eukprot:1696618-Rhodomonas_salina.1
MLTATNANTLLENAQANFHVIYVTDSATINAADDADVVESGPTRRKRGQRGTTESSEVDLEDGFLRGCNAIVSPPTLRLPELRCVDAHMSGESMVPCCWSAALA